MKTTNIAGLLVFFWHVKCYNLGWHLGSVATLERVFYPHTEAVLACCDCNVHITNESKIRLLKVAFEEKRLFLETSLFTVPLILDNTFNLVWTGHTPRIYDACDKSDSK